MRVVRAVTVLPVLLCVFSAGSQNSRPAFEVDPLWPKPLPNRWIIGSVVGLAVDARDHVYILHLPSSLNARTETGAAANPPTGECCRPAPNVLVFDAAGNLVNHWGPVAGVQWPAANHGLAIDPQGNVWIGGSGGTDTQLLKFTPDGKLLMTIGGAADSAAIAAATPRAAADTTSTGVSGAPRAQQRRAPMLPAASTSTEAFGGPAEIAFDRNTGNAYVADGYRNRRVAVVNPRSGDITSYWGGYGNPPNDADTSRARQFGTPVHCVQPSRDGLIYVCDRANNRIQVFRRNGRLVTEKLIAPNTRGNGSVWDLAFSPDPQQRFLYVADGSNMKVHVLERRTLNVIGSFGTGGRYPGQFYAVHSIATDSKGNVYTAESLEGKRVQKWLPKRGGR